MPSLCGYTWIDEIDQAIRTVAGEAGLPIDIAYAIVAVESGFDSQACGDGVIPDSIVEHESGVRAGIVRSSSSPVGYYVAWECARSPGRFGFSHGLLQLHTGGGQGTGLTRPQLLDPYYNLRTGLPTVAAAFRAVWTPAIDPYELIYQVATRSGHPGRVAREDSRITRLYSIWQCMFNALQLGPPPAPPPPPPPAPGEAPVPTDLQVDTPVCSDYPYSVTFRWEGTNSPLWCDITLDPAFSGWHNKRIDGQISAEAPAGFSLDLVLQPDTAYYWRIFNGEVHVYGDPWNVPACTIPRPPPPQVSGGTPPELSLLHGLGCFTALIRLPLLMRRGKNSRLTPAS